MANGDEERKHLTLKCKTNHNEGIREKCNKRGENEYEVLLLRVSKSLGLLRSPTDGADDEMGDENEQSSSSRTCSCSQTSCCRHTTSSISITHNPRHAQADWDEMHDLLFNSSPSCRRVVANISCGKNGIYYPINLAICNEVTPVPPRVLDLLIDADPNLLTKATFELACSNLEVKLQVVEIMLSHKSELLTLKSLRKIAFYDNVKLAEFIIRRYPHILPKNCEEWSVIYGNSIQTFWLSAMYRCGSEYVSESHVQKINLLHYMTSQSNLGAVELIVSHNPRALSIARHGRLPLHVALSNYKGRVYGWNADLVQLLLREGQKHSVGGGEKYGGFGGLFVQDQEGYTPLELAIEQIRNLSCLSKDALYGERWNCLLQCIHFAYKVLGGDNDDCMFLKALATIPFAPDIIDYVMEKYPLDNIVSLTKNSKGQHCMEIVIDAMTKESPIQDIAKKSHVMQQQMFKSLLGQCYQWGGKHLARIRDSVGRLPLVHAVTAGLGWKSGVCEILSCYPRALEEMDPTSGLYLFMVAASCGRHGSASSSGGDLNGCFELLRQYPGVEVFSRVLN